MVSEKIDNPCISYDARVFALGFISEVRKVTAKAISRTDSERFHSVRYTRVTA